MRRAGALTWLLLLASSAAAQPSGVADLWRQAQEAERSGEPAEALAIYERLVELDETHRLAIRARRRIEYLQERAGGLDALGRVMEVRRDPSEASIGRLERELEDFPAGTVRQEARALVASTWLSLGYPERAVDAYRGLLAEADLPDEEVRRARAGLARALAAAGRPDEALEALDERERDGALYDSITREGRVAVGSWIAVSAIALFLLWLGWRTRLRPMHGVRARHLLLFGWLLLVPLAIASAYDGEALDTFAWLALASAPVLVGAVALGHHGGSRRQRWIGALAAVGAEVAVGYLVLVERGAVLGVGP